MKSVSIATAKPSPTPPSRWLSGMGTSSKNTSLTWLSPVISLTGRTVIPGDFMSSQK